MEIIQTNKQDKKLLRFNPLKKERMIIRLYTKQQIQFESKIITGNKDSVSSIDEIVQLINSLLYEVQKKQLIVNRIQISHTHKTKKYSNGYSRVGELSERDVESAIYIKKLFKYPLQMNVVTNLGFTLCQNF